VWGRCFTQPDLYLNYFFLSFLACLTFIVTCCTPVSFDLVWVNIISQPSLLSSDVEVWFRHSLNLKPELAPRFSSALEHIQTWQDFGHPNEQENILILCLCPLTVFPHAYILVFSTLVGRFKFCSTIYGEKCCLFFQTFLTEKNAEFFKAFSPLFNFLSLVGRFKFFSTIYGEKCYLFFRHFSLKKEVKISNIFHHYSKWNSGWKTWNKIHEDSC
jgi:hypothetical protein